MSQRIRPSYILAGSICAVLIGWMATGDVIIAGTPTEDVVPGADGVAATIGGGKAEKPFRVRVETFNATDRRATLTLRGRTEADATVAVRAETSGLLVTRHAQEGARVAAGDLLCELDRGAREARLAQARATLAQAEFDHDAASRLVGRGFTPETKVKALKAALDAAKAAVADAEIELARTDIRSPVGGIVTTPIAETGDLVAAGGLCATIVDADPMLVVGQVSERDVARIGVGMEATASLVTGETVSGRIRFIAPAADAATRTFRVEIETPNPDGTLRDGVTALAEIPLPPVKGHLLTPAILVLDDEGRVGVRTANPATGKVAFMPVAILGQAEGGVWVGGLPEEVTLITVGQDYVKAGATVEIVTAEAEAGK
ncbi:MAG: efflux RND transporter periplasmic adaptor subunit [Hyphomicrobiales bacterium]